MADTVPADTTIPPEPLSAAAAALLAPGSPGLMDEAIYQTRVDDFLAFATGVDDSSNVTEHQRASRPGPPRSRLRVEHRRRHGRITRSGLRADRRLGGHPRLPVDVPALDARPRPRRHADDAALTGGDCCDRRADDRQPLPVQRPAAGRSPRQPVVLVGEPPHHQPRHRVPLRPAVSRRHLRRHGPHRCRAPRAGQARHHRLDHRARRPRLLRVALQRLHAQERLPAPDARRARRRPRDRHAQQRWASTSRSSTWPPTTTPAATPRRGAAPTRRTR